MNSKRRHLFFLFLLVTAINIQCASKGQFDKITELEHQRLRCTSAREFVTITNYLRDYKELKLSEDQIHEVALTVSAGCTNAAQRFIDIFELMLDARLAPKDALNEAIHFTDKSDEVTEGFIVIFSGAFSRSGLDLSPPESLLLAKRYSANYQGDSRIARDDFSRVTEYCVNPKKLSLPRPHCAKLTERLLEAGSRFEERLGKGFIYLTDFLRDDDDGPKLATKDAVSIALELMIISPRAPENFEQSYRFASIKSGLNLERAKAVDLARKIASYSSFQARKP